ncbi:MAG: leucine-rich repeat domain-containing protein, partial [Thermoguttaceae bacterium]|nr:leucine-rich repeat domain-containing protein [Thermoguttaceae bacterium]
MQNPHSIFSSDSPTPPNAFDWSLDAVGRVVLQKLRDPSAVAVVVPAEIDGVPVVAIADDAFAYAGLLTSITLPESVEKIGANAFFHCGSLIDVALPDGLREIGSKAFDLCDSLDSVRNDVGSRFPRRTTERRFAVRGKKNAVDGAETRIFRRNKEFR